MHDPAQHKQSDASTPKTTTASGGPPEIKTQSRQISHQLLAQQQHVQSRHQCSKSGVASKQQTSATDAGPIENNRAILVETNSAF
jgi:hypothetical protein